MKECPKCGFKDNPLWKPLFWRLYWEYMTQEEFLKEFMEAVDNFLGSCFPLEFCVFEEAHDGKTRTIGIDVKKFTKFKCEAGDFWFHFEDRLYYYKLTTERAKRRLVYRFPKGFESMANRKLYEKTPSEKKYENPV